MRGTVNLDLTMNATLTKRRPAQYIGLEHFLGRIIQDFMISMHRTGLSGPQIHVLLFIFHADECQVSDIARLSDSSAAAASQLVERLVQQGLVERQEDPQNRRIKRLRLTEKALRLIHEAVIANHSLAELVESLPTAHRRTVHAALGYLAEASRKVHSSHRRKVKVEHYALDA